MAIAKFNGLKREFVNNAYMADFLATGGRVIPDLSGYAYEHKYYLTSLKAIQTLLDNKQRHITEMKKLFKDCKISYVTCRFYFKGFDVPLDMQKELLKLQKEIYNDITVQMVKGNLNNFKELLEFAKTLKMPIATLIDIRKREDKLLEDVKYIATEKQHISYTKWHYGMFHTWIRRYKIIRDSMNKTEMPRILVGCGKRCSTKNFEEIAIPLVAIARYGFNGSCRDYREITRKSKGRFAPHTDIFDTTTWEYIKQKGITDYKNKELENLQKINNAIDSINPQEIAKRPRVQALFQKLAGLEAE